MIRIRFFGPRELNQKGFSGEQYLLMRHRYVQLFQSRSHSSLLVPSMSEHIMHVQLLLVRGVLVLLWQEPTILLIQILVQGLVLFLNRVPSFFHWSTLVNPNLKGTVVLIQLTVISCIIIPSFPSSMESRPGAQKSYQHCLRCLWKVSCGYSSGSQ